MFVILSTDYKDIYDIRVFFEDEVDHIFIPYVHIKKYTEINKTVLPEYTWESLSDKPFGKVKGYVPISDIDIYSLEVSDSLFSESCYVVDYDGNTYISNLGKLEGFEFNGAVMDVYFLGNVAIFDDSLASLSTHPDAPFIFGIFLDHETKEILSADIISIDGSFSLSDVYVFTSKIKAIPDEYIPDGIVRTVNNAHPDVYGNVDVNIDGVVRSVNNIVPNSSGNVTLDIGKNVTYTPALSEGINVGSININGTNHNIYVPYAEGVSKFISNVTVKVSDWRDSTVNEYYPYEATIAIDGVTENMFPDVTFSFNDATSGNFAPVSTSITNGVVIYTISIPVEDIVISSVILR